MITIYYRNDKISILLVFVLGRYYLSPLRGKTLTA